MRGSQPKLTGSPLALDALPHRPRSIRPSTDSVRHERQAPERTSPADVLAPQMLCARHGGAHALLRRRSATGMHRIQPGGGAKHPAIPRAHDDPVTTRSQFPKRKKSRKPLSFRDFLVGVFSSYAKQLEQGSRLLREVQVAPKSTELQLSPRSLARITPERLAEMVADYGAGMSAYELADKYGHNRGTIMKHLTCAGVRSRVAVPTEEEIFRWRELRAEGLGFKTIARQVGRNYKTIRKYLS